MVGLGTVLPLRAELPLRAGLSLRAELPLGELRTATGAAEAVLLPFLHASVAGHHVGLAERLFGRAVELQEGPGDPQFAGPGLAGHAAAGARDREVDALHLARRDQ